MATRALPEGMPAVAGPSAILVARAARLSVSLVGGTLVLSLVARDALVSAGPVLFAVAALAGLPHGAADVTLLRRGWCPLTSYGAAAALALGLALSLPGPALVVLLLLSVVHFAEGEQAFDRLRGGHAGLLPALAVGWSAVALPIGMHPAEIRELLAALSEPVSVAVLSPAGRGALLTSTVVLILAALRRADRRIAGEILLVAATLAVVPPLAAFAVWFAGWHAVRHIARVVTQDPAGPGLTDLARRTALPSLVAAVGLATLVGVTGGVPPAVVLGLLALTVPHTVVVARELRPAGHVAAVR